MWKKELVKILFSSDPSKLNIKKAIDLKYENTPSSLYRYRSFDDNGYSLKQLKTDKMYLSRPTEFNDPFDCGLKLASKDLSSDFFKKNIVQSFVEDFNDQLGVSNKELGKLHRSKNVVNDFAKLMAKKTKPNVSNKKRAELIEIIKNNLTEGYLNLEFKKDIHVACFSETYESILMWSHYADNHEGFCIKYDFKELGLNDPVTRFIFPVIYKNTVFDMKDYLPDSKKEFDNVLKNYMGSIKEEDIFGGITFPEFNKNVNNMFMFYNSLIKSEDWAYEKEWRYVFTVVKDSNKELYLTVPKPKAIYLGAKISKENYEKILKIAKERNINVYKMEIKHYEFALESNIVHDVKINFS